MKQTLAEQQTRQSLLTQLENEKTKIVAAIEQFYSQDFRTEAACLQAVQEMLAALDRVINVGDWESSLFLRNTVKPLKTMRETANQLAEQLSGNSAKEPITPPKLGLGMVAVYISVFQNKAHSVRDWEQQLVSLPQYILGRPIYREEIAVQQSIRAKLVQTSDAYVCVGVPESAIQSGEYHPSNTDRLGNALLQLIPGSVQSQNILEFVYTSKSYYFINEKLIEKQS